MWGQAAGGDAPRPPRWYTGAMAECANCGEKFQPKRPTHRVCDACYLAGRRESGWETCAGCGAQFAPKRPLRHITRDSLQSEQKYCHLCWRDRRPLIPRAERRLKAMFKLEYWIVGAVVALDALLLYVIGRGFGWW